jgi:hypothetical protein
MPICQLIPGELFLEIIFLIKIPLERVFGKYYDCDFKRYGIYRFLESFISEL